MKRKERDDDDEEEGEEERMEKFFALIRSTREVRKVIMSASHKFELPYDQKLNINVNSEKKLIPAGTWTPVFRPEDFMEKDGPTVVIHDQAEPSRREGENKGREEENKEKHEESEGDGEKGKDDGGGLNLKLSL